MGSIRKGMYSPQVLLHVQYQVLNRLKYYWYLFRIFVVLL
jgi:hypothetical protein